MELELKVPSVGESIQMVQISEWLKSPGDQLAVDEPVVILETDKATVEVPAPSAGILKEQKKAVGEEAQIGDVLAIIEVEAQAPPSSPETPEQSEPASATQEQASGQDEESAEPFIMPAAQRLIDEHKLDPARILATGPGHRMLKEDVEAFLESANTQSQKPDPSGYVPAEAVPPTPLSPAQAPPSEPAQEEEEVVPMSPLRRRIAERLVDAQKTAALLTTFNEIDMSAVSNLRKQYQEAFQKRYNLKLGFMSFFVKAAIDALKAYPAVNAEIRGTNIVFKNHYDIGIAIGGGKGLVVPVLRKADEMSFAEVESVIAEFAQKAKENRVTLEDLQGGTFTITNGGVYGSLLSTPIVNPPQSGILGMHSIQNRPVAIGEQVVIRPLMYVALTYDHRIVDGREAVTFLVKIKQAIEDPARMLLDI